MTRTQLLLAVVVAAGAAACPLNLDYLKAGRADAGSDDSATDGPSGDDADSGNVAAGDATADVVGDGTDDAFDDAAEAEAATGPGDPALAPDAATFTCPTTIDDALSATDPTQIGRHSRVPPTSTCQMPNSYPGTKADPSNLHLYHAYHFVNPTAAAVCFNFTLTYDADVGAPPAKYMAAYGTFYPADLSIDYLADVGGQLTPPMTMGTTVPANGSIDVVVYAVDVAPAGPGPYTLSCATQ